MKKEMLINVLEPEECRIAILEDGVLEELYIERTSHESYIGNIYKGRIVNIEPSIQAVFVDFGVGRNGFLHVSDVAPQYYRHILEGKPAPADPLLELPICLFTKRRKTTNSAWTNLQKRPALRSRRSKPSRLITRLRSRVAESDRLVALPNRFPQ
jgi:Rne/Rng family ribonuclease